MTAASCVTEVDTLGLVGDGDDEDLIASIEESFKVRFGDEAAGWRNVGDLHATLVGRMEPSSAMGLCATSMAFHALRRALSPIAKSSDRIAPRTRLSDVVSLSPKQLQVHLRGELGIVLPPFTVSGLGCLGLTLMIAGVLAIFLTMTVPASWPALALLPLGWALTHADPGTYGTGSVGDLARAVAARNFAHFTRGGADRHPDAVWRALCALIEDETGRPAATIFPRTAFY